MAIRSEIRLRNSPFRASKPSEDAGPASVVATGLNSSVRRGSADRDQAAPDEKGADRRQPDYGDLAAPPREPR
jgi:hypothetical protein